MVKSSIWTYVGDRMILNNKNGKVGGREDNKIYLRSPTYVRIMDLMLFLQLDASS